MPDQALRIRLYRVGFGDCFLLTFSERRGLRVVARLRSEADALDRLGLEPLSEEELLALARRTRQTILDADDAFSVAGAANALPSVLYDVFATAATGRTIGKWACGLRVATLDGARPTFLQGMQRESVRILSALFAGLGYLPALFSGKRALHDYWADTQVVHDRE